MIGQLFLKKDVFEEVVRFRKVAYFLIERMPFGETDVHLKDVRFLRGVPLLKNRLSDFQTFRP